MKKLQSYLMRPEELRKKLENPRFRHQFVEWSKANLSVHKDPRNSRSKSPGDQHQKSLQINLKKSMPLLGKENSRTNKQAKIGSSKPGITSIASISGIPTKNLQDRNRSESMNRNALKPTAVNERPEVLSAKHRYNSCSAIDYKRQRSLLKMEEPRKTWRMKYSYRTKQGQQINNPNKTNQDSLVIKTNLGQKNISLFAVADGHGLFGHLVSQYIAKNLTKMYETAIKLHSLGECIPRVFEKIQKNLTNSQINVSCSGSTLVNVMVDGDEVICANVGDSRAILARQIDRKSWEMIYLSQDHKPCVEAEKKRILKCGGRVHAFKDQQGNPVGPLRVWLPNQNLQGLAMSRSFGDNISKAVGVTSQAEVIRIKLDKRDRFILLASDGVWEFITSQQVLQLLVPFHREGKLEQACDALLKLAYERWTVEDTSVVDDVTFILIFFQE